MGLETRSGQDSEEPDRERSCRHRPGPLRQPGLKPPRWGCEAPLPRRPAEGRALRERVRRSRAPRRAARPLGPHHRQEAPRRGADRSGLGDVVRRERRPGGQAEAQPLEPGPDRLTCGPAAQGPDGSRGAIGLDGLSAEWDLAFAARSEPLEHLRPAFLYGAALPKTKATSPAPDVDVSGSLVVDGSTVDLAGWTGMVGHNWGSQHAARWVWLRVCGLGDDGTGWLDAVLGRVQVGPVLAPWKAFGALESSTAPVTASAACSAGEPTSRCAPTVPGSPWPGPTRRSPSRRRRRSRAPWAGSTPTRAAIDTRSSTARSRR